MGNHENAKTGFKGEFERQRYNQEIRNPEVNVIIGAKLTKIVLSNKM